MGRLLKQMLLICVFLVALTEQAIADSLSDAQHAYAEGDFSKAVKLFMPLAEQGNAFAQFNLGFMYAKGQGVLQDDKEAVRWYRTAVKQGEAKA